MSSTTGNTYQRTAKQRANGRKWCGYAPGRYSRHRPDAQPFSWWALPEPQGDRGVFALVAKCEARRICALPAPYVSREME